MFKNGAMIGMRAILPKTPLILPGLLLGLTRLVAVADGTAAHR
jgi:hypothetical protein